MPPVPVGADGRQPRKIALAHPLRTPDPKGNMSPMTQLGITLTDQDRAQAAIVAKREAIFKAMRARLRDAGFQVKAVSWIRRQDDNEFAELPKWGWTGEMEEQFLDLVTRPGTRYFISRENDRAYWLAVAE